MPASQLPEGWSRAADPSSALREVINNHADAVDALETATVDASDIVSGTIATARLGSGSASSSTFLRGDQTWATPSGSGGGDQGFAFFLAG